jgi:excinuclease UvrABC nuclease subunit
MRKKDAAQAHYIEKLASRISTAQPYWNFDADGGRKSIAFPAKPGIYLLMRKVNLPHETYRTKGVNLRSPLIMYVGKSGNLRERMRQHFGGSKPNYQGSQFVKFLYQICQDEAVVARILTSPDTLIAHVVVEEGEEVVDFVENLAMQVFQPRFNIKDR